MRARPMRARLLAFTSSLGGGGAEKHLVRVLNHLDRDRFRITAAVVRGGGSYQTELARDVDLRVLGGGLTGAVWRLARLIDRLAPHVVFSIMDHANCVALAAAALAHRPAPVVVGVQIPPLIEWRNNPRPSHNVLRLLIPQLYPRARRVVALSRGVAADLAAWMPPLREKIEVIHNAGFDEASFFAHGEVDAPATAGPIIVGCGRLVEQKGFAHLIDALPLVRREIPTASLWIVGDGPLRGCLEEQARRLGVGPAVWFAGFRSNPGAYMKRADVFALSSLWEGFANVVVEAMSVGVPVVATDCPHGPSEIIRSDGARPCEGLLVPPADPAALAAALVRVLREPALCRALARGGLARAADFSPPRIAARYGETFWQTASVGTRENPLKYASGIQIPLVQSPPR
jgi:glycosyltransferase involved in cell wall biosynthesis